MAWENPAMVGNTMPEEQADVVRRVGLKKEQKPPVGVQGLPPAPANEGMQPLPPGMFPQQMPMPGAPIQAVPAGDLAAAAPNAAPPVQPNIGVPAKPQFNPGMSLQDFQKFVGGTGLIDENMSGQSIPAIDAVQGVTPLPLPGVAKVTAPPAQKPAGTQSSPAASQPAQGTAQAALEEMLKRNLAPPPPQYTAANAPLPDGLIRRPGIGITTTPDKIGVGPDGQAGRWSGIKSDQETQSLVQKANDDKAVAEGRLPSFEGFVRQMGQGRMKQQQFIQMPTGEMNLDGTQKWMNAPNPNYNPTFNSDPLQDASFKASLVPQYKALLEAQSGSQAVGHAMPIAAMQAASEMEKARMNKEAESDKELNTAKNSIYLMAKSKAEAAGGTPELAHQKAMDEVADYVEGQKALKAGKKGTGPASPAGAVAEDKKLPDITNPAVQALFKDAGGAPTGIISNSKVVPEQLLKTLPGQWGNFDENQRRAAAAMLHKEGGGFKSVNKELTDALAKRMFETGNDYGGYKLRPQDQGMFNFNPTLGYDLIHPQAGSIGQKTFNKATAPFPITGSTRGQYDKEGALLAELLGYTLKQ